MKTSKVVMLRGVVGLLLFVMLMGIAQAATVINQNFDNTSIFVPSTRLGDTGVGNSATSVGLWKASGQTGVGGALIADTNSYSSSQSLEVVRIAGYETGQFIGFVDNGPVSGTVEVSFRAKRAEAGWSEPVQEYEGSGSIFIVGDSAYIDTVFPLETIGLQIWSDNNVYVIDNGAFVKIVDQIDTPGWATPGTWHAYKMVIDMDNHVYDVYYSADGTDAGYTKVYDNAVWSASLSVAELNAVRAKSPYYSTYRGPVWFDDVVMTGDIYMGPSVCGDPGTVYLALDFNTDCYVNLMDFAQFATQWLSCSDPANSDCDQYWK